MRFTYETQGAITYLVCELESNEQIDSLTLGMLTNNHIVGLAPVLYTEMNGQRFLKYNISAKVSSDQFFSGNMNKQRTLLAFQNILNAICSADEYMIEQNCFSVAPEHIFLNVSNCETAMICIPVTNDKDINPEVAALFKNIMFSTQFDSSEDASYITQLITYINSGPAFNVYGMKELVSKLQSGTSVQQVTTPSSNVQHQFQNPHVQQPTAPASSFDSTITMDEMPTMLAQKHQAQNHPAQDVRIPIPPLAQPNPQPQVHQRQSVVPSEGRPINNNTHIKVPQGGAMSPQTPVAIPKPAVPNSAQFAIPSQPVVAVPKSKTPPAPAQKQNSKTDEAGEKKISLFGLLANYNKENVELYKKQKAEAKAKKASAEASKPAKPAKPAKKSAKSSGVNTSNSVPNNQQMPADRPVMPGPALQQFTKPQYHPPVQPVPVQNSFNETTVLSPIMAGGETTVLSDLGPASPYLIRVKTGERISINKPVFRIGKEKSYVDYFIADNTAISRSHANIHTENNEYFIEDTNSTNHTYVNDKLINSNVKIKLANGDKIRLANEDFTFSV